MSFTIKGTGSALPELVVTNDDLSRIVDTSDEWITTRTGVKERRVLSDETLTDLALEAAEKAMADAGIKPQQYAVISTRFSQRLKTAPLPAPSEPPSPARAAPPIEPRQTLPGVPHRATPSPSLAWLHQPWLGA